MILSGVAVFYLTEGRTIFRESSVEGSSQSSNSDSPITSPSIISPEPDPSVASSPPSPSPEPDPSVAPSPTPEASPSVLPDNTDSLKQSDALPFFMVRLVNESDLRGKSTWELDIAVPDRIKYSKSLAE